MTEAEIGELRRGAEAPVEAAKAEVDAAATDLSLAFADYPMFRWMLRDDARCDAARLELFRLMLGQIAFPGGVILRPPGGGAASVWMPSERLGPNPILQELRSLPTLLAASGFRRFGRLVALRDAMDRHHPMDRPHAYLWFLGVHPDAQGLGIGSRLLAAGLARVDAEQRPAFLETSTEANVALYRRHGFEVASEYYVRPGSPPTWAMWREAQA